MVRHIASLALGVALSAAPHYVAAFSLMSTLKGGGSTGPTVAWKAPAAGGTLSGDVQGPPHCEVEGTRIRHVMFYINGVWTNTDGTADNGFGCWIDTRKYANGTYRLHAVAYDSAGRTAMAERDVVIQNTVQSTPQAPNQPPTVSITAPEAGATLSGTVGCAATASDDKAVASVRFSLGSTVIGTDTSAPYTCSIDTTQFADGTYTLMALATDNEGASASAQRSVVIQNALPSTGTRAINTFHSIGLYWTPPANPGAAGCQVRYRRAGSSEWRTALPLWYDARNNECRGSIVHVDPDTQYDVQFALPGQAPIRQLSTRTWSENFPIAKVVHIASGNRQINITEGGSASGYVLYTPAPGTQAVIDVANAADYNVTISAPYVIVRGLTLRGARMDGIRLLPGARDVVIEGNDISGWGRDSGQRSREGWIIAVNEDSGIKARCDNGPWLERTIIQRNRIHNPRYGANSWSDGHPLGPNAVYFNSCGGNHVIRYNEISSQWGRYFNDGIGGCCNFSNVGMPTADSDIYGNRISHVWDDAIESEGANRNVRIWGNYMDEVAVGVASTVAHQGPVYIFRNVLNRTRMYSHMDLDSDGRNSYFKSGSTSSWGHGRRYVFHNTMLQAEQAGLLYPLGGGAGLQGNTNQPLTNTVSRNNIYHIWKSHWSSIRQHTGSYGNDADYDLYNGVISDFPEAQRNGIRALPIFAPGHGWQNWAGGNYQLAPHSPGFGRGERIPNFNDNFTGSGPDMGAHQANTAPMRFGIQ